MERILHYLHNGLFAKISYMFGAALIIASLVVNAIPAKTAEACAKVFYVKVNGTPNCLTDGHRTIGWKVQNDWSVVATIAEIHVYDDGAEISNYSLSGFGVGTTIAAYSGGMGEVTGTMTLDGNVTGNITLKVKVYWSNPSDNMEASGTAYLGEVCPTQTPTSTSTATNTPDTPTNTPTNTATITETPTNTPTNTPDTPTSTPTDTPVTPTSTFTNTPTNTPVTPTSTSTNTPTNTPVTPTSTSTNTPTITDTPTNTPTSTDTPTPTIVPTLPIPVTGGDQQLLIPVTGADLTNNGFNKTSKIMMNFGFGFIGLGLVLQGFSKKRK